MAKRHNPTPEERDERFSLYGLDPEKVGEAVLNADPESGDDDRQKDDGSPG